MTKPLVKPEPYEVVVGWGSTCVVLATHSLSEAEREYNRLVRERKRPALFLGDFCLRGER